MHQNCVGAQFERRLTPYVSWIVAVVDRLDRLISDGDNAFLLPAARATAEHQHADIEMLNRALESMPGVNFSTRGGRYGFSPYGGRDLGFAKSEGKVILDHLEGTDPKDVTGTFYSSDPAIKRKWEMVLLRAVGMDRGWIFNASLRAMAWAMTTDALIESFAIHVALGNNGSRVDDPLHAGPERALASVRP